MLLGLLVGVVAVGGVWRVTVTQLILIGKVSFGKGVIED